MVTVATFYGFAPVPDPDALRDRLAAVCAEAGARGTVLVASEGVNATLAGARAGVEAVVAALRAEPGFADLAWGESVAAEMPFGRMKVERRPELVALGRPGAHAGAGARRVRGRAWDALVADPAVAVIDVRNAYEVAIGSFPGAVDPGTGRFGDFPAWWAANAARFRGRRVAMFCTGGIRCEKAAALVQAGGAAEVTQLDSGILGYLAEVPAADSRWQGECFVFDRRVALGQELAPGRHGLCPACRRPVSEAGRRHPAFEEGVQCPACAGTRSGRDRARFRERRRQMRLAEARGTTGAGD